jgi:hypothetical protein
MNNIVPVASNALSSFQSYGLSQKFQPLNTAEENKPVLVQWTLFDHTVNLQELI